MRKTGETPEVPAHTSIPRIGKTDNDPKNPASSSGKPPNLARRISKGSNGSHQTGGRVHPKGRGTFTDDNVINARYTSDSAGTCTPRPITPREEPYKHKEWLNKEENWYSGGWANKGSWRENKRRGTSRSSDQSAPFRVSTPIGAPAKHETKGKKKGTPGKSKGGKGEKGEKKGY